MAASDHVLSLRGISVRYGSIRALENATIDIGEGEIIGLVGHNGAGKSTLVNAVTGAVKLSDGEIYVDGEKITHDGDPLFMERHGMQVIHQEPALIENLSVADNIAMKRKAEKRKIKDRKKFADNALGLIDCDIDSSRQVVTLNFGTRQLVDLARALASELKVLFLDEPTAALGKSETERLHAILKDLAAQKKAIVYVSHRLRDIMEVCGRIIVLRGGQVVLDEKTEKITSSKLHKAIAPEFTRMEYRSGKAGEDEDVVLEVSYEGQNLQFEKGEIVGLFGMAGGPQFTFLKRVYGIGEGLPMILKDEEFESDSPAKMKKRGVCYVSMDRERESLFHHMSGVDNLCMPWFESLSRNGFVTLRDMKEMYEKTKEALKIYGPSLDAPINSFSGGNRQKHVLGRWLFGAEEIDILLLEQPFSGVDIEARVDIARAIRAATDRGMCVIVASSEVDEINLLCDRAYICECLPWSLLERSADWEEKLLEGLLTKTESAACGRMEDE